jgi:hypothetical protein
MAKRIIIVRFSNDPADFSAWLGSYDDDHKGGECRSFGSPARSGKVSLAGPVQLRLMYVATTRTE